jgi:glycosyltransferase involved in cell wall biosynthesis
MKRVLVLAFDFPPQGGTGTLRVAKFVKYLPQFGWQPIVVCSDATWNPDGSLAHDVPPRVPVHRVPWPRLIRSLGPSYSATSSSAPGGTHPSRVRLLRSLLAQSVRHLLVPDVNVLWTHAAWKACIDALRDQPCDAILTTSPPHSIHFVGYRLRSRFNVPWIADFRDAWTADNQALRRSGRLGFALQRGMEHRILSCCDRAVMVTAPLAQRAVDTFDARLACKVRTITNGFDPDDFASPPPVLDNGIFSIAFVGNILGPQVDNAFPDGLRQALTQSESFRKVARVRFVGRLDPSYHARLAGLEANVDVHDFVPHSEAIDVMRRSDVLLLILPNTDLARMTFTNKFFEYLAARRPLLAIVPPGIVSDIVTRERIGMVAHPDDAQAIARALLAMFESPPAWLDPCGMPDSALARFDRRELTRELVAVLDEMTGG